MYNNIGLQTPRGSGTSGYIMANRAKKRNFQSALDFARERKMLKENILKPERRANKEIIDHNTKRQVYVKLAEIKEQLKKEGKSEEEIEKIAEKTEKKMLENLNQGINLLEDKEAKNSHQLAELKDQQFKKLQAAFEIEEGYDFGSAFDFEQQEKQRLEKIYLREQRKVDKLKGKHEEKIRDKEEKRSLNNKKEIKEKKSKADKKDKKERKKSRSRSRSTDKKDKRKKSRR